MTIPVGIAAASAALALVTAPAHGQPAGSRRTRDFVEAVGQSNALEIFEARTALAQSRDERVRTFARKMIADHMRLQRTFAQATARSGLEPPGTGVGADQAALLGALQDLDGTAFDRAYARHQALAHRSALTTVKGYAATGDDAALRAAATDAAPIIAAHLAQADRLEALDRSR